MRFEEILKELKALADAEVVEGMSRFGINTDNTLGISISDLRKLAKRIEKDHLTAQKLWAAEIHEARILASIIDEPELVTEEQMEDWVKGFDSWDLCDQVCNNLFRKTDYAYKKAAAWSERPEEFVKRAGFVLMAVTAVHDKEADDEIFLDYLKLIKREAEDDRNFVKKAVNWALRQIGKKNKKLKKAALETAEEIKQLDSKSASWIAKDALKELKNR
jgi:3-methyladenine DNA glycosylase AlkD